MKNLVSIRVGQFMTINYTGEMKHFGDTLAEAAMEDIELERQILCAANEIRMNMRSREKGEQLISQLLNNN